MAGTADAAKSAFEGIFNKTKEALSTAAETTKGYASQATQAIGKIVPIPGHQEAGADPNGVQPAADAGADPNAQPHLQ